jgi:hypothetical protein
MTAISFSRFGAWLSVFGQPGGGIINRKYDGCGVRQTGGAKGMALRGNTNDEAFR